MQHFKLFKYLIFDQSEILKEKLQQSKQEEANKLTNKQTNKQNYQTILLK